MKTYILSLKRSENRRRYIEKHANELKIEFELVDAIDSSDFTDEELLRQCDAAHISAIRDYMTNDQIACSLSHHKILENFLASGDDCCFIIEDDLELPTNIKEILNNVEKELYSSEIVLLYYTANNPCKLSNKSSVPINNAHLIYPIDLPVDSAAYIITRSACLSLIDHILPIKVSADDWSHYYHLNCYDSIRMLYPPVVKLKNFPSSINYHKVGSVSNLISKLNKKFTIPFLSHLLNWKRAGYIKRSLKRFLYVDEHSHIHINLIKKHSEF